MIDKTIIYVAAINSCMSLLGVIFSGIMAFFTQRINKKVNSVVIKGDETFLKTEETSLKIDAVQETSDKNSIKLKKMQQLGIDTHKLVNGNMAIQVATYLHQAKNFARKIAEITKDPEDVVIAIETLKKYDDHMNKLSVTDVESDAKK